MANKEVEYLGPSRIYFRRILSASKCKPTHNISLDALPYREDKLFATSDEYLAISKGNIRFIPDGIDPLVKMIKNDNPDIRGSSIHGSG